MNTEGNKDHDYLPVGYEETRQKGDQFAHIGTEDWNDVPENLIGYPIVEHDLRHNRYRRPIIKEGKDNE